jgi:hypothetical protein
MVETALYHHLWRYNCRNFVLIGIGCLFIVGRHLLSSSSHLSDFWFKIVSFLVYFGADFGLINLCVLFDTTMKLKYI